MENEQPYSKEACADTEKHLNELSKSEHLQKREGTDPSDFGSDTEKIMAASRDWWETQLAQGKLKEMAKEEADALHVEFERLNQNVVDALQALNDFKKEKLGAE